MHEHCGKTFMVYQCEPTIGGAFVPSKVVEVRCCPFCGCELAPLTPPAVEAVSPAMKRIRKVVAGGPDVKVEWSPK